MIPFSAFAPILNTFFSRMQCETVSGGLHGNALIRSTARKMLASPSGMLSYYRGLGMGLAGMFPYSAIDLFIFEKSKSVLVARKARIHRCHEEDVPIGNFATGAIGALSGAVSATMVYPLNLLRTRLQAQGTVLHQPTYSGILDVTRRTIQGEGFVGLFRGVTPNLLKVAPAVSISYIVYENAKALMGLQ
jgi:solute carrier family 25 (mitochondrial phosphate transporter), member 23/24/25/41